jgi:hypothetical protein
VGGRSSIGWLTISTAANSSARAFDEQVFSHYALAPLINLLVKATFWYARTLAYGASGYGWISAGQANSDCNMSLHRIVFGARGFQTLRQRRDQLRVVASHHQCSLAVGKEATRGPGLVCLVG